MKKAIALLWLFIALIITGCSSLDREESSTVNIHFAEPNRIQFQGKGAGAGIALMSTMGPVGIALGVAIDEGIAKDIRGAASTGGFDMQLQFSQSIDKQPQKEWRAVFIDGISASSSLKREFPYIEVKRYGFKTTGGADDTTSAELVVLVNISKDKQFEYHFPNDFIVIEEGKNNRDIPSHPLAELKINGELSVSLMEHAVDSVIGKVTEQNLQHFSDL